MWCRECGELIRAKFRPSLPLCWECHFDGEDNADVDHDYDPHPLPSRPTRAMPSTRSKLVVLEERYQRGEQLHHPLDARIPSGILSLLGEIWLAHLLEQDELEVA